MLRTLVALGWMVWLCTIGASAAINFLAGYQFGRETNEAYVFAALGVSADLWKAIGPVFIVALWRAERRVTAGIAFTVWLACFLFAISAALGLAAQNRSAMTGKRETVRFSYESASQELRAVEHQHEILGAVRSPEEIESGILVILARPVGERGTVGSLSEDCNKDHWRTRTACAEVAALRHELTRALEARRLADLIVELKRAVLLARERGGSLDSDPQARLISRLSFGLIAAEDVGVGVVVLLGIMVELISAFAPLILHEAWRLRRTRKRAVAAGRGLSRNDAASRDSVKDRSAEGIFEYLIARILPDGNGSVGAPTLYSDYVAWCGGRRVPVLPDVEFFGTFETLLDSDLKGRVERRGSNYYGFRLAPI